MLTKHHSRRHRTKCRLAPRLSVPLPLLLLVVLPLLSFVVCTIPLAAASSTSSRNVEPQNATAFCDDLRPKCLALAENSANETCADGFVDYVCYEPAGMSRSGWCFHCQCGSEQLMDAQKCSVEALTKLVKNQTIAASKKPSTSPKPKLPTPKRPSSSPDNEIGGPGTIVPQSPGNVESRKAAPASMGKATVIGGGIGGGLAGILVIACVAAFFVTRRRRRFGKGAAAAGIGSRTHSPSSPSPKPGDHSAHFVVDEFNADEVSRKKRSPRNSVRDSYVGNLSGKAASTEKAHDNLDEGKTGLSQSFDRNTPTSSMPALALLARSDSMTRIKAAPPSHPVFALPPTNPFSDAAAVIPPATAAGIAALSREPQAETARPLSPFADPVPEGTTTLDIPESAFGMPAIEPSNEDPLYIEHLRERQEMRQHWQQRSASPEPALTSSQVSNSGSSAPLSVASSPALFSALASPRRPPTGLATPLVPSPLRTASTLSAATTESTSSGGSYATDRQSSISTLSSSSSINAHPVLSAHVAQRNDELTLSVGDTVVVWRVWEDGWCIGSIVGAGGVGQGIFPVRCLRSADDADEAGTLCGWEGARSDSLLAA
ncbi:hypothetical protein HDU86_005234 [Geranomyces michiganensis]|nr:hypothetical protein HDU86_005234 [Geranomyces michiganensis]